MVIAAMKLKDTYTPWKESYDQPAAAAAKSFQSCPTLCDPMDYSLPGSYVHGIFQARYWSELPFPSPGDLPDPGIEPESPALQADSLPTELQGKSPCRQVSEGKLKSAKFL